MDTLLSRLTWPSVLVRERAGVALAELMSQEGPVGERARNALMEWIGQQNLESTAALGILVFCRLADGHPERLAEPGELDRALKRPSLLSFELLKHLYGAAAIKPDWSTCHSSSTTPEFIPPEFFDKFRTNFLPPIYSTRMEAVQNRTMLPIFRQWAFEWTQLVSAGGYQPSERVFDFGMRPRGSKMIVDFPLSEVYRSAYLRSLAWAVTSGKLSEEAAVGLALEACPVDLGLWGVHPGIKPAWWPTPKSSAGTIDTVPAQVWEALSSVWDRRHEVFKETVLLAASGRVLHGNAIYDLSLRAMFQVAHGPVPGEPEEIMKACHEAQGSHSSHGPCFGGTLDPMDPTDISLVSHDWSILPASVYVRPRVFPRWQYWRGYSGVQLPASFLASDSFSFHCEPNSVKVFDGAAEIGSWRDWTDGVTEEFVDGAGHPHGWTLEMSSELTDKFAGESRSTLGWICELKVLHRGHEYEPFREFSVHQLYGTTNLVLP
jgi:hypothetical protein